MTAEKQTKAPERFIRLLKKAMDEHPDKLSLRQVAVRADISAPYLSLLLNGERALPSNRAIAGLEEALNLPKDELFKVAGKPSDETLEFFRKDEAGAIMRALAPLPNKRLAKVRKMIERYVQKQ